MGLGQQLLELRVLRLKLAQTFGFVDLHSPELRPPTVERRIAKTVLATQLLHRHASFRFLQKPDDLLLGKALLFHVRLSFRKRTLLTFSWWRLRGAGHTNNRRSDYLMNADQARAISSQ